MHATAYYGYPNRTTAVEVRRVKHFPCKVYFLVSGHNATDKTPMYEMPLIFVFGGSGFEVGESIFCLEVLGVGVLSLAFCPEIIFPIHPTSNWTLKLYCYLTHSIEQQTFSESTLNPDQQLNVNLT